MICDPLACVGAIGTFRTEATIGRLAPGAHTLRVVYDYRKPAGPLGPCWSARSPSVEAAAGHLSGLAHPAIDPARRARLAWGRRRHGHERA
jgi:hypothetical protein